jgi:hypothetical protein
MARRGTSKPYQIELEDHTTVEFKGEAIRRADQTGLPQTIHATTDPDMRWTIVEFTRGNGLPWQGPDPVSKPYRFLPLVTFLPANYFVR